MSEKKSVEWRLYEAYRLGKSIKLSCADLDALITHDDAIKTRITNALAGWEVGSDATDSFRKTARQLSEELKSQQPAGSYQSR